MEDGLENHLRVEVAADGTSEMEISFEIVIYGDGDFGAYCARCQYDGRAGYFK